MSTRESFLKQNDHVYRSMILFDLHKKYDAKISKKNILKIPLTLNADLNSTNPRQTSEFVETLSERWPHCRQTTIFIYTRTTTENHVCKSNL